MNKSEKFKEFIECILRKNGIEATWALIALEKEEWELYSKQWKIYVQFIDEYEEKNGLQHKEEEPEWEYFDHEEHFAPALCCPSEEVRTIIDIIEKNIDDLELKKSFEEKTSFLRSVINISDADYLIIINLNEFSMLFGCEYSLTIAHETIHIVDLCNQKKHSGEWIDGQAAKYSLECIDKLEEGIKNELLKYDLETGQYDPGNGVTIGLKSYIIPK
jgi:hypothetical protein